LIAALSLGCRNKQSIRSDFFFLNQVVPYGCSSAVGQLLQIGSGYTLVLHEEGFHLLNIGILWFVRRSRFAVELFNRFIDLCSRQNLRIRRGSCVAINGITHISHQQLFFQTFAVFLFRSHTDDLNLDARTILHSFRHDVEGLDRLFI